MVSVHDRVCGFALGAAGSSVHLRTMTFLPATALPWVDRAGRFSPLRALVLAGLLAPAAWLVLQAGQGLLGARPVTEAIHQTGNWAVRFLLLSLLVTPLRSMARWPQLVGVRRMIGLAALGYAAIHAALYVVDQRYDLVKVASEIMLRTYLTIGFIGLVGLIALGMTSTDAMVRRMGAERWNRLHAITYWIAVLALVHFILQRKLETYEPVLMAGLFLWLMGWRVLDRFDVAHRVLALAALAIGAGVATMVLEAGYLSVRNGFPFGDVLFANLDMEYIVRPGWWVIAAGLAMTALRLALAMRQPVPRNATSRV
jgi:methionine sulfoxide reductase heme-binding subunit